MAVESTDDDWIVPESVVDPLQLVANVLYLLFAVQFVAGLYIDWSDPGQIVIPPLSLITEPYPTSGLFISAIITVVIGYLAGKSADVIEEKNKVKFDQTQEWVVDIKGVAADDEG